MRLSINTNIGQLGLLRGWLNQPQITSTNRYASTLTYIIWIQITIKALFRLNGFWVIDTYVTSLDDVYNVYSYYIKFPNPLHFIDLSKLNRHQKILSRVQIKSTPVGLQSPIPYLKHGDKKFVFQLPGPLSLFSEKTAGNNTKVISWQEPAYQNANRIFKSDSLYRALVLGRSPGSYSTPFKIIDTISQKQFWKLVAFRFVCLKLISKHSTKSLGTYHSQISACPVVDYYKPTSNLLRKIPAKTSDLSKPRSQPPLRYVPVWKYNTALVHFMYRKLVFKKLYSHHLLKSRVKLIRNKD